MSVKDVNRYYKQICAQYKEMVENIKELEQEAAQGLLEPERVDRLRDQVAPLKINYERWAYMMFLLNQPARKNKQPKYKRQNEKLLKSLSASNSIQAVIEENEETLKHVGE